ncbi:hypothetical protein L6452_05739 [Arctium lappa]|uniref:Uncharacterized protein n=1 Tax=Arctium lappa TaxID=4217 RepID=A0ACB9EIB0_ARCLA|nr:hypothetical protein L6452_05739 [Arctium lappa]
MGTASKGDTHAETIIPREVQQTQPTVQHPDQENMVELWQEIVEDGSKDSTNSPLGPIEKKGKKVVEEEDMAWEPSEEVPLKVRKSKRKVTHTGLISKITRKQRCGSW